MRPTILLCATVIASVLAGSAYAQESVRIRGTVSMAREPVVGAQILVFSNASQRPVAKAKSKKNGKFNILFFPVVEESQTHKTREAKEHPVYRFQAAHEGLLMTEITVSIGNDENTRWTRPIGPDQVLPQFEMKSGLLCAVDIKMASADHFD